jgi:hypothetical protein
MDVDGMNQDLSFSKLAILKNVYRQFLMDDHGSDSISKIWKIIVLRGECQIKHSAKVGVIDALH